MPAYFHLSGLRIDFDAAYHAAKFLFVIVGIGNAPFRQRHGKTGRTQDVLAVLCDERRAMIADRIRNRAEDLVRFEIAQIDPEVVERIFRQNISMGKGMGLMSMVQAVRALAKRAAAK